ncbi:MarR family transcriptional regulator [Kribbella sp. NPDC055071]
MPGGRLSHQDRVGIAAGLTKGLGYAEIARELDRPTSTVSREIARNGGAQGYRADHAHYATAARARRRNSTNGGGVAGGGGRLGVSAGEGRRRSEFVERFATMMVQGGLPRMASRVLAVLYTSDSRSLTAAELVQELRVSPASISTAIGYLERVGMVHREPDPRRRMQHYVIADEVWTKAWEVSSRTNLNWAETAAEGAELLGPDTPAGERLTQMASFFHRLGEDMSGGLGLEIIEDGITLLAALMHAARPLTADQLSTALDWPLPRVINALTYATENTTFTAAQLTALSGKQGADQAWGDEAVGEA